MTSESTHPTSVHHMSAARGPRRMVGGAPGLVVFVLVFGSAVFLTYRTLTTAEIPPTVPLHRDFVCIETGRHFESEMKEGDRAPVMSPFSHKATGYPAEKCFWTRGGKQKKEPTYVVLNSTLGKPGDTFCADCGRVVIGHNPVPPPDTPFETPPVLPMTPTTSTSQPVSAPK